MVEALPSDYWFVRGKLKIAMNRQSLKPVSINMIGLPTWNYPASGARSRPRNT
jgi:hypothetical protein